MFGFGYHQKMLELLSINGCVLKKRNPSKNLESCHVRGLQITVRSSRVLKIWDAGVLLDPPIHGFSETTVAKWGQNRLIWIPFGEWGFAVLPLHCVFVGDLASGIHSFFSYHFLCFPGVQKADRVKSFGKCSPMAIVGACPFQSELLLFVFILEHTSRYDFDFTCFPGTPTDLF